MVKEEVIVKPTVEDVTKELASLVEKEANEAIKSRGKFIIGLSGKGFPDVAFSNLYDRIKLFEKVVESFLLIRLVELQPSQLHLKLTALTRLPSF